MTTRTPLQSPLLSQRLAQTGRIITGLVLRETKTRFGKNRLGYIWALLEPAVYVSLFVTFHTFAAQHIPFGESYILFIVPGLLFVRMFLSIAGKMLPAISSNQALLAYPRVKPFDIIVARFVLETLTMITIFTIFIFLMAFVGGFEIVLNVTSMFASLAALVVLAAGIGTLNAVVSILWPTLERIWQFMGLPMLALSGVFYVPYNLPPGAIEILEWNPLLHCIEWFRTSIYLSYDAVLDRFYPFSFGFTALALGLSLERIYRRKIVRS